MNPSGPHPLGATVQSFGSDEQQGVTEWVEMLFTKSQSSSVEEMVAVVFSWIWVGQGWFTSQQRCTFKSITHWALGLAGSGGRVNVIGLVPQAEAVRGGQDEFKLTKEHSAP